MSETSNTQFQLITTKTPQADLAGPAWNNSTEYPSIASNEFTRDLAQLDFQIRQITEISQNLKPLITQFDLNSEAISEKHTESLISLLQTHSDAEEQAVIVLMNLMTFVSCERSIDGKDAEAQRIHSLLISKRAQLATALKPMRLFLDRAPEPVITRYLLHESTSSEEYSVRHSRQMADTRLSENEETLLEQLRVHAIDAWGNLYNQISGTLVCKIELPGQAVEEIGLAEASGLLRDASEPKRRAAWLAIQNAWKNHEQSCAGILNGLTGWRLETYKRRSVKRPVGYLDFPIHNSAIKAETLEAMMLAVKEAQPIAHRAMRAIARGLGKQQMDPWDILAPAPTRAMRSSSRSFKDGLALVRDAFSAIDESQGDFVSTMEKNRWIEGRVLPNKRQGAYCTRFAKSHSPRVFQTYMGSIADIRTLAHELGHAYHAWVMRDLPNVLHHYPMTLAETASIFAETAFADHMASSGDKNAEFEIAWQDAESAASFLLNIPARFDFERLLNERREKAAFITPEELGDMTEASWRKWYGDTLSKTDRQFWMTKLHFSMAHRSFYNFPYTFGYLFSLAIFSRRELLRSGFQSMYVNLLRDTGRMSAEELAQRHLREDITTPEFWKRSLDVVESQVERFEKLLGLNPTEH